MANNYSQVAAVTTLVCTEEEATIIKELLAKSEEEGDTYHGFTTEFSRGELYLFAEESGTPEELPEEALEFIGKLITKNNLPYLEFGYAFTCSKMRPGEFGGGQFRIYPSGVIVWPGIVWPESALWKAMFPDVGGE